MQDYDARREWHAIPLTEAVRLLDSDLRSGLLGAEASARLESFGANEIRRAARPSPWQLFARQFASVVIWILIAAAVVSAILGERLDAAAILTIVVLNAVVGFFQEYRAEQSVAALSRLTAPNARVIRDGAIRVIPGAAVVPGDVVVLEAGDLVAGDGRLIEASALAADEASLTGESEPVAKSAGQCAPEVLMADRTNMVFMGTSVVRGTGRALVVATGMETEFGRIAQLLEGAASDETPLQKRLDKVARQLLWACLGVVLVVFALGIVRGEPAFEMFLSAVSLAVAAIPEGLPAVVTVALALGVSRMAARSALVRRLHSVETLGCAQVICTDKTGTLTAGQMTARRLVTSAEILTVTGEGYRREGGIFTDGDERTVSNDPLLRQLLVAAAACNDAHIEPKGEGFSIIGDPTEGALLVLAAKGGLALGGIDDRMPRLQNIPFSSERKRMAVIRRLPEGNRAFVKGAPETILQLSTQVSTTQGVRELTDSIRASISEAAALMAGEALRVIACAERGIDAQDAAGIPLDPDQVESQLTFLGLIGMQDPPRAEALPAVRKCRRAGIRTVMITGDHPDTARAIARQLEILGPADEVVSGSELERMSDSELAERVPAISVYARVTAEHKLRIIRAWKSREVTVAMTGDGVNDAPALKDAAIGVAMGTTGTEVAKEAADVIVADDNFASIVAAVEEGRGIYDNIAKTLTYLMGGNAGELLTVFVGTLLGWPLPLLPTQLLWINLVTDGLPALALATDPIDVDVLSRPPRDPKAHIIDMEFILMTMFTGLLTAAVALTAFGYEFHAGQGVRQARSAAFFVLVTEELLRSFNARSTVRTIWQVGILSNARLFAIVVVSFGLQLIISQTPLLEAVFETEPVSAARCLSWVALGIIPLAILQTVKAARQRRLMS
jgi:Ca2+-transporting ATPase